MSDDVEDYSNEVQGPLVMKPARQTGWLLYEVPNKRCTEDGRRLTPLRAHFYGGIHSGVTWTLVCSNGHEFEWDDYVCNGDAWTTCGHPTCPAEQERRSK